MKRIPHDRDHSSGRDRPADGKYGARFFRDSLENSDLPV